MFLKMFLFFWHSEPHVLIKKKCTRWRARITLVKFNHELYRNGGGVVLHNVWYWVGGVLDISQVLPGEWYTTVMAIINVVTCQVHSNGSRGDFADSFAFSTLFPNVLQVGTLLLMFHKIRICVDLTHHWRLTMSVPHNSNPEVVKLMAFINII